MQKVGHKKIGCLTTTNLSLTLNLIPWKTDAKVRTFILSCKKIDEKSDFLQHFYIYYALNANKRLQNRT